MIALPPPGTGAERSTRRSQVRPRLARTTSSILRMVPDPCATRTARFSRSSTARSRTTSSCGDSSRGWASLRHEVRHRGARPGYEEWGERLVRASNGMFAFAIWDSPRGLSLPGIGREETALRQPRLPPGWCSASMPAAVKLGGSDRPEVEPARMPPSPVLSGISRARATPSGACGASSPGVRRLRWRAAGERSYWSWIPENPSPSASRSFGCLGKRWARLMSDVAVGVLLSGGVDSAADLGLTREARAERLAPLHDRIYVPVFDERTGRMARAAGALRERPSRDRRRPGTPDSQAFATARLVYGSSRSPSPPREASSSSRPRGRHVKVVLGGDGGDELFGGYPKYRAERLLRTGLIPRAVCSHCSRGGCPRDDGARAPGPSVRDPRRAGGCAVLR